ncbi:MAG: spermidine/putrescine ABC transporter substrate-binding protein [Clostridia bacterium]|nr:spermidine/putrescine ABC transporter substrate-binding protein [Clostridia bacterium]
MIKKYCLLLVIGVFLISSLTGCGETTEELTLNVYNWGEYISDGSEDSLDVNAEFEAYCEEVLGKSVSVNYTTYASNEDMYNKLKSGSATYDVVIPSEYMIEKMIEEDMLAPLDFSNIPNYEYIDESFKNLFYDPENTYSVPYTCGMVGIIYNSEMVDEADLGSWDLLWNENYKGQILQFNNPRDAFGTAIYWAGDSVNSTDTRVWEAAAEKLKLQKPLIQSYVMDEIFNKMKNGSAAIAPYYAGDYMTMYDSNDLLGFYYPEEGTNVFVDAMCVPACAKNKELAEQYINFMLEKEIAVANAEYIGYASPHTLVREDEEYIAYMEDWHEDAMEILYAENSGVKTEYYESLDADTLSLQNGLWESLKIENSVEPWIYITSSTIVGALLLLFLYNFLLKKYRNKY